ncbi:MFS transporter [Clostridium kluyveri]|uniref:MFS transporter n=1 Tax=Clostridium kluyveri TaxID=1534 RepID=A0A1L5F8X0_CLOKL|nr:MFS transporter [Clostridium kluyveri]APM39464.1 MFS transporter [Clostridium kluyveri]
MNRFYGNLLTFGHFVADFYQGALPALLPFLVSDKHFSYAAAAFLIFSANVSSSIIQPLFGICSDKISVPWTLPLGVLLAGISFGMSGAVDNYWVMAVFIALSGVGIASFHPEGVKLANTFAGENKATGVSRFAAGGNIGFAVSPIITTEVLLLFGLKGTIILALPALVMCIVFLIQLPKLTKNKGQATVKKEVQAKNTVDEWKPFSRLTATLTCRAMIFFGLNAFLPLYWIHVLNQSKRGGSIALSTLIIVGAVGTLIAGRMADKFGNRRVIMAGFLTLIPLLFIFINVRNVILATLLLIPIGLSLYAPYSPMVVLGQKYLPNHMGLASGVTLGLAVTMGGVISPVLGWISDNYGIHTALSSLTILPIIAVFLTLTLTIPKVDLNRDSVNKAKFNVTRSSN